METRPTTSRSLETYYHIDGSTFEKQYKEILSGYRQWSELSHADEWLVFPKNIGKRLCIDETAISDGELYTIVSNPEARGGKGSLVALVKGVKAQDIIDTLETFAQEFFIENLITRINTDDYYYDRSDMVKKAGSFAEFAKHYDLDVPEALELELMKKHIKALQNGQTVYLPKYDMSGTAKREDNVTKTEPAKIIISEGLFTLTDKVIDAFDFKIYVDVSCAVQKERYYRRAAERDLGSSADDVYMNAASKAKIHIHPTKEKADIILSGEADREAYKIFIKKVLSLVKDVHFNSILMYS